VAMPVFIMKLGGLLVKLGILLVKLGVLLVKLRVSLVTLGVLMVKFGIFGIYYGKIWDFWVFNGKMIIKFQFLGIFSDCFSDNGSIFVILGDF
jgi:hypothetical protein